MKKHPKYSPAVIERAVRMVSEPASEYESQWAAITSIAAKIGCTPETLRRWVRQQERDSGQRPGPTTAERERINALYGGALDGQGRLRGAVPGKVVRTTVTDAAARCSLDRVGRQFKAQCPNQRWVNDFTYVSTWQGLVYMAFGILGLSQLRQYECRRPHRR